MSHERQNTPSKLNLIFSHLPGGPGIESFDCATQANFLKTSTFLGVRRNILLELVATEQK